MPHPTRVVSYRAVLRLSGVPRVFTAATIARLSYATISLSLLVTIQQASASYAVAGSCLGAYALASFAMPAKSRLVDRWGQRRALPLLSAGLVVALAVTVIAAAADVRTAPVYLSLSAAAGLTAPPLGPSMRALWAALTPESDARQRAYSLDAVVEEILFAVGPLLVGAILTFTAGAAALAVTALLNLGGTIAMVTSPAAARHGAACASPSPSRLLGPLRHRGFVVLVIAMLGIGLGSGPTDVAVLARAQAAGHPGAAGYLLAALSVGSAVGGLVWGGLRHRRRTSTQLGLLVAVTAVGGVGAAVSPTLWWLGGVLLLIGLVSAPALIVSYLTADRLVPAGGRTEATTWVNTSTNTGVALGAAAAGMLIDDHQVAAAFLAGAFVLALTAGALFAAGNRLEGTTDAT